MANAQHSSKLQEWYTPKWLVEKIHKILPQIDLDPASSVKANISIKADRILTKEDNALDCTWSLKYPITIYMNPPGGKLGNSSLTGLFWRKLMELRDSCLLSEAIVMGFSLEQLAVTQNYHEKSMGNFPLCIPRKRIKFISPTGKFNSPTHSNVIVYVAGMQDHTLKFTQEFQDLGVILYPRDSA